MADYISSLPDDILSYLLSSLTVRDSFRLRSLSPTWKDLPDTRSVLLFDGHTILKGGSRSRRSAFVQAVDQFFKLWKPHKATALKIEFGLEDEYASHIDAWIATVIGKEIAELDLDFNLFTGCRIDKYVFPCNLLDTEKESCLKHLRLEFCDLTLLRDVHRSWLNKLSTIELIDVSLELSGIECILSNTVKLESLSLKRVGYGGYLCVQHPSLKKLVISQNFLHLELICPHLEILEFKGLTYFMFTSIPLLREASLEVYYKREVSPVFSNLAGSASCLQTLFLLVASEIHPVPRGITMSCLKRLDLLTIIPSGFDILGITHMLYASPVLEELCLKRDPSIVVSAKPSPRRYVNRPHYHLKEVKFEEAWAAFYCSEVVEYLLENCLSLQKIIFEVGAEASPFLMKKLNFIEWQNNNPTVELIVV